MIHFVSVLQPELHKQETLKVFDNCNECIVDSKKLANKESETKDDDRDGNQKAILNPLTLICSGMSGNVRSLEVLEPLFARGM